MPGPALPTPQQRRVQFGWPTPHPTPPHPHPTPAAAWKARRRLCPWTTPQICGTSRETLANSQAGSGSAHPTDRQRAPASAQHPTSCPMRLQLQGRGMPVRGFAAALVTGCGCAAAGQAGRQATRGLKQEERWKQGEKPGRAVQGRAERWSHLHLRTRQARPAGRQAPRQPRQ